MVLHSPSLQSERVNGEKVSRRKSFTAKKFHGERNENRNRKRKKNNALAVPWCRPCIGTCQRDGPGRNWCCCRSSFLFRRYCYPQRFRICSPGSSWCFFRFGCGTVLSASRSTLLGRSTNPPRTPSCRTCTLFCFCAGRTAGLLQLRTLIPSKKKKKEKREKKRRCEKLNLLDTADKQNSSQFVIGEEKDRDFGY